MNRPLIHRLMKRGSRPGTLLLVHGNSSSSAIYHPVYSSSVVQNQIIAFDLPGHGNSTHFNDSASYTFQRFTDAIIEVANCLDEPLVLVGHSLGGHLAIRAAKRLPRLKGLVICGTPPLASPPNFQEAFLAHADVDVLFTEKPLPAKLERFIDSVCYLKQAIGNIMSDFSKTDGKVRPAMLRELSEGEPFNEIDEFNSLTCSRFIIRGSHDPLVNPVYLESLASVSAAQLITIKECGHYMPAEQPSKFNEILHMVCNQTLSER